MGIFVENMLYISVKMMLKMIYYMLFEMMLNCDVDLSWIFNVLIKLFGLIYYLLMMYYDYRIWELEGVKKNCSCNILWFCYKLYVKFYWFGLVILGMFW